MVMLCEELVALQTDSLSCHNVTRVYRNYFQPMKDQSDKFRVWRAIITLIIVCAKCFRLAWVKRQSAQQITSAYHVILHVEQYTCKPTENFLSK